MKRIRPKNNDGFIFALLAFMVLAMAGSAFSGASIHPAADKKPANQAQQTMAVSASASQSLQAVSYFLILDKIYLVKNRIHIAIKNTGAEKVPAKAYAQGKLILKSRSFDKKWGLSEVDPGQMLNQAAKAVDFDTQLTLSAPETVKVRLDDLIGEKSKQASLAPLLLSMPKKKDAGSEPMSPAPLTPHLGSDSLVPAGVHSEGIVITSPRAGNRFLPGATLNVRFYLRSNVEAYGAVPTSFRVILYEESGSGLSHRIYSGPSHEASYVIPADMHPSDKYKVYVAGEDNLRYYCTTGHFTIRGLSLDDATSSPPGSMELAPYLHVTAPEAYATWNKGCSYTVTWRSNVTPRTAAISLVSAESGSEFAATTLRDVAPTADGAYSATYLVPNSPDLPPSGAYYGYRIKVTAQDSGEPVSGRGEALKIQAPYLNVDDPDGTASACRGYDFNITWSYAGCRGRTFRITLLTDLPLGVEPRILHHGVGFAPGTEVGGYLFQQTYTWAVPADLREGTYRIMVETNPTSFAEQRVTGTSPQFMIHDCD